jgi:hypothetical protein
MRPVAKGKRPGPQLAGGGPLTYAHELRPFAAIPLDAISSSLHRPARGPPPRIAYGSLVAGAAAPPLTGRIPVAPAAGDPPSEEPKAEPAETPRPWQRIGYGDRIGWPKHWEGTAWHVRWTQPGRQGGSRAGTPEAKPQQAPLRARVPGCRRRKGRPRCKE